MRVFVTGATGFVGSAAVPELLAAGHDVVGLARSDAAAAALVATGATPLRGTLDDAESLRRGAATADGVLHLAIARGGVDFTDALETDRRALAVLGAALEGTGRPLVFASATSMIDHGRVITEHDVGDTSSPTSRGRDENAVLAWARRGVRVAVVRLPTLVHGDGDRHGFLPMLIEVARTNGFSAFVGDGHNRWPGVHRHDVARLLRLVLENAPAGSRAHAVADEEVAFRDIARAIGDGLGLPTTSIDAENTAEHFAHLGGSLALLPGADIPASGAATRKHYDWYPTGPDLLTDLRSGPYLPRVTVPEPPVDDRPHDQETGMQVHRSDSEPTTPAPEQTFTGNVTISGYFRRDDPSRLSGARVMFPPAARTPWKVNPAGQTIVVTGGAGRAQGEGEDIIELRAGDLAWFPPGQWHWEGAAPDQEMTCIVLHESTVEFGERVTDEQYRSPCRS
ncbi:NAD-dependent epimerase/dehydratase family protein [Pseudonocardia tropica]|uniref:NAD-dependent epimerase/dehydratase family protein n=1 Tax=Pseudonocardia tropica TaxID=681289 RepID=A0ABV1K1Z9_9PSEU